ncbi:MAG: RAD55 family ATPase [Candidatus Odinarchaeota archaeon]
MSTVKLLKTDIFNLDSILGGGIPEHSLNIITGQPGSGKTILAQQILFNYVKKNKNSRTLFITTLSEPNLKTLRYLQYFTFFDSEAFGKKVIYHDMGSYVRDGSLDKVLEQILELVGKIKPEILVIDSFKAISEIIADKILFRKFCYDLAIHLAITRCTAFLVGEYGKSVFMDEPEFAIADGILFLDHTEFCGEHQWVLQVLKMRGKRTDMNPCRFSIDENGINVLSPALSLQEQEFIVETKEGIITPGIPGFDMLLPGGFQRGSSIVLSGESGTGKTTFILQFLIHGTKKGEKLVLISFDETPHRLYSIARSYGWNLEDLVEKKLLKIISVSPKDISVEKNLEQIIQQVKTFKPSRFAMDSFSLFIHKVEDPVKQREVALHLFSLVELSGCAGIFAVNVPAGGKERLSSFRAVETIFDGIILLSSEMEGNKRKRYIEVCKMRAADHVKGKQRMIISNEGIEVFHISNIAATCISPPPLAFSLMKGIIGENIPYSSAWLINGDPGIGKSTMACQFAIEGLQRKEAVLYIAADTPSSTISLSMLNLGFLVDPYVESGYLYFFDIFNASGEKTDASDPDRFLLEIYKQILKMPKPLRLIIDSLSSVALDYSATEFVKLIHRKNQVLQSPDISIFDIILRDTLSKREIYKLVNSYDVCMDLYIPDWGEMKQAGETGSRVLRVKKARGIITDTRPYPYVISSEGIQIQKNFYLGNT